MNLQINNHYAFFIVTKNKNIILQNKFISRSQGFQVRFSEQRTLLALVDTFLVLLAILGAVVFREQSTGDAIDIITHFTTRWYWGPIMLGSRSGWQAGSTHSRRPCDYTSRFWLGITRRYIKMDSDVISDLGAA
jgi:hypothetical protein